MNIKSCEITLKNHSTATGHNRTQLIRSRCDTIYNDLYIFSCRGCDDRDWISDRGTIPCLSTNHSLEVLASHSVIGAFLVLTFQYAGPQSYFGAWYVDGNWKYPSVPSENYFLLVTHDLEMTRFFWCLTSDKCSPLHCSGVCIIQYLISLKSRKAFIMSFVSGSWPNDTERVNVT